MDSPPYHVVTGALGYSGRRIAERLLQKNLPVRTLTNSPNRPNPFGDALDIASYHFDQPDRLTESLREAAVLYNTYWIRFDTGGFRQADAVRNTRTLFEAAKRAGVGRVVHISITNPSEDSPLQYFRMKAEIEQMLRELELPHTILRPTLLFGGGEDILINNIAWNLRRFPIFPVFSQGKYRLQPIHVDDLARLAVEAGTESPEARPREEIIQAIGPETFRFREMIEMIARSLGLKRWVVPAPDRLVYAGGVVAGWFLRDIMLTWPEVKGLMQEKLFVETTSPAKIALSEWTRENADTLGRRYHRELARRTQRDRPYREL